MQAVKPTILILGPTAGGKTRLAIDLALRLPPPGSGGECISCDSMQIYRVMDIGTAKPTPQERAEVPHHVLDVTDPSDDSFSVDRWLDLAHRAVNDIRSRDRFPIIVGGTNLYVKVFLEGMMLGPEPDLSLRARLNALEPSELRQWLERVDPPAAERIHPNDRKRTIRAIEVFEQTGKRLSDMQTQWKVGNAQLAKGNGYPGSLNQECSSSSRLGESGYPFTIDHSPTRPLIIGLEFSAEFINRRINARVRQMIDAGFVDEVRRLYRADALGRNAREALGYKQILEHLEGKCSLDDAIEQVKIRTRRYAKQQRTWLRRFRLYPNSVWIAAEHLSSQELADKALAAIEESWRHSAFGNEPATA